MAPTTLLGQASTTSPPGRNAILDGHPIRMSEILASLEGTAYIERVAVNSAQNILRAKKAVKKAFQCQMDGAGFNMIEVLSQCPTNWKMNTVEACRWIDEVMSKTFPIGVIKDAVKGRKDAD